MTGTAAAEPSAVTVALDEGTHALSGGELTALIAEATSCDGHAPFGEHILLTLQGQRQVRHARFTAHLDGRLAGYLVLCESLDGTWYADLATRPSQRSRGVGTALLQAAVSHIASHGGGRLRTWAYDHGAPDSLARRFAMQQSRAVSYQTRQLADLPNLTPPTGARVRQLRSDEAGAWLELNNQAFAGHPENGNWTHDDLTWRLAAPWTDLTRFLVLADTATDQLLGGIWTKVEPGSTDGELYVVAVHPDHAGQGLGRALVNQALHALARTGLQTASLYVDTVNTAALTLYARAGFTTQHTDRCFELTVPT